MRALGALLILVPALARGDPLLTRDVVSAAAVECSTGVYRLQASLGEAVAGRAAADSTTLHMGFWSPRPRETTPVGQSSPEPSRFWLGQNAPNPFNPLTRIEYSVPGAGGTTVPAQLAVFDVRGRLVRTLVDAPMPPGLHAVEWRGEDAAGRAVASGIYLLRLDVLDHTATRRLVVLK